MNRVKARGFSLHQLKVYTRWLTLLSLCSIVLFSFYGCDSSSPEDSSSAEGNSELVISLTDAEGDFLSYTVDVVSLKMLKSNGAEVETLPLTTRLDFARYVEVSEFLTAATVPSGHYSGAQIVLDFSNAEITIQDKNGNPIKATVQDSNGNPITQTTVDISFNGHRDFVIAAGIPAHITLDFDLDASNAVIVNGSEATVVVSPVLVADTILEEPKPHRLRGVLGQVNQAENQFNVFMRPFRHRYNNRFGQLKVHVSDNTSYEIDGRVYAGNSGLNELAQLNPAAAVIVLGVLTFEPRQFEALEIYAGSSVPWGNKDIVTGNVISRSGNTLLVRGATISRTDGSFAFNDNISIILNNDTSVVKQAEVNNSDRIADISVGQRITVLGNINDDSSLSLNADLVRMLYTNIGGSVVSASPLAVDLQTIDHRRIALFDFSGTGVDPANDADSNYYEVDSGTLSLANLQIGDPVKIRGYVRPFASAPEDFSAQTIINAGNMRAHLITSFGDGSLNAITSISENSLQLDLDEVGEVHYIYRAGIRTDLLSLSSMPLIAARESGKGLFVITQGHSIRVYTTFTDFQTALNAAMDGNTAVLSVQANGVYDSNQNRLLATKINVRLLI
ncbi:MAG TPA: metallophosphoesterase [Gammaproteobacteria bacterium]|nr:metallophosphoesterase [Gammaproteobacteria bacterium]